MSILSWIEDQKRSKVLNAPKYITEEGNSRNPSSDSSKGLWTRCDKCGVILYIKHLKENQRVCFGCSYHLQMSSQERIENLIDKDTWRALDETMSPCDPLQFHDQKDYTDRLQAAQERTGLQDAVQTGTGMIENIPVALGVMDFEFMGGSMGSVVGEKITRLIEYATQEGLTLLIVCASGGARMQEGVFSLMQMAKISSALQIYQSCANLLYISILTSPTTGGVTASFAMLGDIIFAEPKALIAFAGRRVIEQTLREDLPDDFQTSEYMLHHGLVDLIVPRRFLRQALSESIRLYQSAPFKKVGKIPFGVQNPISFVTEEKIRRKWGAYKSSIGKTTQYPHNQFGSLSQNGNDAQIFDTALFDPPQSSTSVPQQYGYGSHDLALDQPQSTNEAGLHLQISDLVSVPQSVPLQARRSLEYRELLTSFETIFDLFSKTRYVDTLSPFDTKTGKENEGGALTNRRFVSRASSVLLSGLLKNKKIPVSNKICKQTELAQNSTYNRNCLHVHEHALACYKSVQNDVRAKLYRRDVKRLYPNLVYVRLQESTPRENTYNLVQMQKDVQLPILTEFRTLSETRVKARTQKSSAERSYTMCVYTKGDSSLNDCKSKICNSEQRSANRRFATASQNISNGDAKSRLPIKKKKHVQESLQQANSHIYTQNFETNRSAVGRQLTDIHSIQQNTLQDKQYNSTASVLTKKYEGNTPLDVDFLNQAIEIASIQSVEWRAFYMHQHIAKTAGFLEDFVRRCKTNSPSYVGEVSKTNFARDSYKAVFRNRQGTVQDEIDLYINGMQSGALHTNKCASLCTGKSRFYAQPASRSIAGNNLLFYRSICRSSTLKN